MLVTATILIISLFPQTEQKQYSDNYDGYNDYEYEYDYGDYDNYGDDSNSGTGNSHNSKMKMKKSTYYK